MKRTLLLCLMVIGALVLVTGCAGGNGSVNNQAKQYNEVNRHAQSRKVYLPKNEVEFNNYNRSQKLYDSPTTIIWCSTTWGNPSAPMVTIPVAGKLTSSTTSYFSSEKQVDHGNYSWQSVPARSVDGLYHPNPPQYRYGFTPGGQYVDFFNMPTFCTTAPTKFQRQKTRLTVAIDRGLQSAQRKAAAALASGNKKSAQRILETAVGGN